MIVAAHARGNGPRAEGHQVVDNVACAAEPKTLALQPDDRHRRFGRNARHPTPQVLIDHQVADHQEGDAGKSGCQVGGAGSVEVRLLAPGPAQGRSSGRTVASSTSMIGISSTIG